jgi:endo-1,4-beta-xylanase
LKPENVFDAAKSREMAQSGDNTHPAVKFGAAKPLLDYAKANNVAVHGHVLVWHSQTPRSFFTEDYTEDGKLADRETMLNRLENYIASVMKYLDENYKGVVLSWDVVNEAVLDTSGKLRGKKTVDDKNGTYWMDTVGEDYILQAFTFARKYAPQGTKLFYNDYSVPYEPKLGGIKDVMEELMNAGVVDGIGFQCHYQLTTPSVKQISSAMEYFAGLGLAIRVSELDIPIPANTPESLLRQAKRYKDLMDVFLNFSDAIDAVTVWGTSDDLGWKSEGFPLLFDKDQNPKPAFWAWADPTQLPLNQPEEGQSDAGNKARAAAAFGRPDMTGTALDPVWERAQSFPMMATQSENADEGGKVKASFRAMWQPDTLYVLADITDSYLDDSSVDSYRQDSVEVFVDEGNHRAGA